MSSAAVKRSSSRVVVPRRSLFLPATPYVPPWLRRRFARVPTRSGFKSAGSMPIGLHYSGPRAAGFTREVFTIAGDPGPNVWVVPVGVASIDVLMVGGGGLCSLSTDSGGAVFIAQGGGGGGGVVVTNGLAVVTGESLRMVVGVGNGGVSLVRNDTLGGITIAGPAGGGGNTPGDPFNPATPGGATNGSGAGGTWDPITGSDAGLQASVGDGTGGDGGNGAGLAGVGFDETAGGGGGGAGGNGTAAVAGAPGNQGTPGNGGNGIIPPPSSFGPWGTDIGEAGFFGGGGPGRNYGFNPGPVNWIVGGRGLGGGAANTGGGGIPPDSPAIAAGNGFSGIVVIVYATP